MSYSSSLNLNLIIALKNGNVLSHSFLGLDDSYYGEIDVNYGPDVWGSCETIEDLINVLKKSFVSEYKRILFKKDSDLILGLKALNSMDDISSIELQSERIADRDMVARKKFLFNLTTGKYTGEFSDLSDDDDVFGIKGGTGGNLNLSLNGCYIVDKTIDENGNEKHEVINNDNGKKHKVCNGMLIDSDGVLVKSFSDSTIINIPNYVVMIGDNAFKDCKKIKKIVISDSVKSVGYSAFKNCSNLEKIIVPDTVTDFHHDALEGCNGLKSAGTIGSESNYEFGWNEVIPDYAFYGCSSLKNILLPNSLKEIGCSVFSKCAELKKITIPSNVSSIGSNTFSYCTNLEAIKLPKNLLSVSSGLFSHCSSLKSVELPQSIETIGENAFSYCTSLETIKLPEYLFSIPSGLFSNCSSLNSIELPQSVETIGSYAFTNCKSIVHIDLPNGIKSIGGYAFSGSGLLEINIPDGVTDIDAGAFNHCSELKSITIPKTVNNIGFTEIDGIGSRYYCFPPFYGCDSLTRIEVDRDNNYYCFDGYSLFQKNDAILIRCFFAPDDGLYEVPYFVKTIGCGAFKGCLGLKTVKLPTSIKSINGEAFEECSGLEEIIMSDGVEEIRQYAFSKCTNLRSIVLSNRLKKIENDLFKDCSSIKNISLPDSICALEPLCFAECVSLECIKLSNQIKEIGSYAFANCISLKEIVIPNSVKTIKNYVFKNCVKLENVVIPDTVTEIGTAPFKGCRNLVIDTPVDSVAYKYAINSHTHIDLKSDLNLIYEKFSSFKLFDGITLDSPIEYLNLSSTVINKLGKSTDTVGKFLMKADSIKNKLSGFPLDDLIQTINALKNGDKSYITSKLNRTN